MTLSSTQTKNQYTATGGTGFDYTFRILDPTQLKVITQDPSTEIENEHEYLADYSVAGSGEFSGGRVSFAVAPTTGHTVTILRNLPLTQELDLLNNDPFDAEVLEETLDKHCMIFQQHHEEIGRAVKVAPSSNTDPKDLVDDLIQARADAQAALALAETARADAESAETGAGESEAKAARWAEEEEDVEVDAGQFSARHYAAKAAATAAGLAEANETQAGIVELATDLEGISGSDTTRALTAAVLRSVVDSRVAAISVVEEQQSIGTSGGTFTAGAWRTRALNATVTDGIGITLSANRIAIPAGKFLVIGWAFGHRVSDHVTRLFNTTDSYTLLTGSAEFSGISTAQANAAGTRSMVNGIITLADTKTLELQHYCTGTITENGYGKASSITTNVYAQLVLIKLI